VLVPVCCHDPGASDVGLQGCAIYASEAGAGFCRDEWTTWKRDA
jgi:hypothetical protein